MNEQPAADLIVAHQLSRVIGSPPTEVRILDDVSLRVPRHGLFAINGPSGSGKSTLLNLLTGIDRPTSGEVIFDGRSLVARGENALARWRGAHVGIVFQFFHLLPTLTASENVLLALELGRGGGLSRSRWRQRTQECLEVVGMDRYAHRLPGELSGGEQQRVAIARALANDPPLIVADEPTGNLDSTTAASVFEVLESLTATGKTVVYVTHNPELAARSGASIDLLDGRVTSRRQPHHRTEVPR